MRLVFLHLLIVFSLLAHGQESEYTTNNQKAIGFYQTAQRFYNSSENYSCMLALEKALEEDSNFVEVYVLKSEIYNLLREYENEIKTYNKILQFNGTQTPKLYMLKGEAELKIGRYSDAQQSLTNAFKIQGLNSKLRNKAKFLLACANFALESINNPVPFSPKSMGDSINTEYNDYWPSLTADEKTLITTVELPGNIPNIMGDLVAQEDFFISTKDAMQKWTKSKNMGPPINTQLNEGAESISFDGQYLFFTGCNRKDGIGRCDIYFSQKINNNWSEPKNIGKPINSLEWESQPCMSSDGRTLYFVSNRYGGFGGKDIWMTRLNNYGLWEEPVNLGDSINTPFDEMSPFIHEDNQTLYFSSDGHVGMGGQDIFISRRNREGKWGKPVNLGYPINTYSDEYGLIVNSKGVLGMFATDRPGTKKRDIFSFEMPLKFRPAQVSYVSGVIYDKESQQKIRADLELSDLETDKVVVQSKSFEGTGEYLVCLQVGKDYALYISKDGYLFHSENLTVPEQNDNSKPYEINIPLQTIQEGRKVVLNNIFFKFDSYELEDKSKTELKRLIDFMKKYPNVYFEISGHTDNMGTEKYNKELSDKRAEVVWRYLIEMGINSHRISHKGYGYSQPATDNNSEASRAKNRRTEFKITKTE